jgi:hypothetical protein
MRDSMSRYFFDLEDADGLTTDETGTDFQSREDMHRAAVDELHEVSRDDGGSKNMETQIRVRDQSGKCLFKASLSFTSEWVEE